MKIKNDKDAKRVLGTQVYAFNEGDLISMVIEGVTITKRFCPIMDDKNNKTVLITTALGEFDEADVYASRDEIVEHIDKVLEHDG